MTQLNSLEIKKLQHFNDKLTLIEEKIYNLALEQNQIALKRILNNDDDITDYELEIDIIFYINEKEIVSWNEYMKHRFLDDSHCNINDKENHNVSSSVIKSSELNSQQHCWLMHRLYDDFFIDWDDILCIDTISFDINVCYQYSIDLNL